VADFSYQNDQLAQMVVSLWTDPVFRNDLVADGPMASRPTTAQRINNARIALASRGIGLTTPIVLTEAEYHEGWDVDSNDQVVFVLPNLTRQTGNLLETAKLLMACTPNGI
jgi:hypothetical protein